MLIVDRGLVCAMLVQYRSVLTLILKLNTVMN